MLSKESFREISPADFFYRNRDIAGFSNPSRAVYSTIREILENSLDACEIGGFPPDILIKLETLEYTPSGTQILKITAIDNGTGVPHKYVPQAFGQVFFGSKYVLRQSRGTFGLGGKMAYLYGQITTHTPLHVITGYHGKVHEYLLRIDIQRNQPIILKESFVKRSKWHGVLLEFNLEGNYRLASAKILEYLKETAMVTPYANITFIDPDGRLIRFYRVTREMPTPPRETLPHPHGVDVEGLRRLISTSNAKDMKTFLTTSFHRIGSATADSFLSWASKIMKKHNLKKLNPKKLIHEELVMLARCLHSYDGFLLPDASCLSPIGPQLLKKGIQKELKPEFVEAIARKPSAYSGHPFIVEAAIAYGGNIPPGIKLYRFANRIPLLYDESSDVSWKVVFQLINWKYYKIDPNNDPVAVAIHIASTKIPYKTVGKEFIADRPEIEREILNAVRELTRKLSRFIAKREKIKYQSKRFNVFKKYLPVMVKYAALTVNRPIPDISKLLKRSPINDEET
ncbi:DNA topoisomerase VI subunit B [Thermococci archaeon]|nr:MAG: DNA topoisomerase VI subunit B [Thermococci archaeon]